MESCRICGGKMESGRTQYNKCLKTSCQRTTLITAEMRRKRLIDYLIEFGLYASIPANREPTESEKEIMKMTVLSFLEDYGYDIYV